MEWQAQRKTADNSTPQHTPSGAAVLQDRRGLSGSPVLQDRRTIQCRAQADGAALASFGQLAAPAAKASSSDGVAQLFVNPDPAIGSARSFRVYAADLGTGTNTTPAVRAWVQGRPTQFRYTNCIAGVPQPWVQGWTAAPNPPPVGAPWDAGHVLARQNGGPGNLANDNYIMPQNPQVNRGNAGTYASWRAHEVAFHTLVAASGEGIWEVN